jgi:hypothetical protein
VHAAGAKEDAAQCSYLLEKCEAIQGACKQLRLHLLGANEGFGRSPTRPSKQQHNKILLQKTFVHLGSSPPKLLLRRRRRRRRLYDGAPLQNVCFDTRINRARGRYISRCF